LRLEIVSSSLSFYLGENFRNKEVIISKKRKEMEIVGRERMPFPEE